MPQDPNNRPADGTSTDQTNGVNDGSGTQETKSFSEEQVNSLIQKRINEVNEKHDKALKEARAEWERQAKLTEDERAKEAQAKRLAELEEREREVTLRERRAEAAATLAERHLPAEFVDYVVDTDEDKVSSNIDKLEKAWKAAVDEAVKDRLQGTGSLPVDRSGATTSLKGTTAKGVYRSPSGETAF